MPDEILPYGSAVKRKCLDADDPVPSRDEVAKKSQARTKTRTPLGERIELAMALGGFGSGRALEAAVFPDRKNKGSGRISRYMTGTRGQTTVDPEAFMRIAELCGVDFTWLLTGRGQPRAAQESPPEQLVTGKYPKGAAKIT